MRQRGMARTFGLVLVAVAILGLILYVATRPPVSWPSESRRIVHPAGFSIIAPPDWDHFLAFSNGTKPDTLRIEPKKAVSNIGSILLTHVMTPIVPDDLKKDGYSSLTFQGRPAYSRTGQNKYALDHTRSFLFERDGTWFDLTIRRPAVEPIETGVWLAYAESFRVEPVRLTTSATLPTTTLSITP